MNAERMVQQVRAELRAHVDEPFRKGLIAFFRESVNAYGVRSPGVQAIARAAYREAKSWPRAERERFAELLWKSGRLEECSIAIYTWRRFTRDFGEHEFDLFETWIDRYVHNWANCDGVASWLLAGSIENAPALMKRLLPWTAAPNRWKRRASAVAMLQEAKRGRNTSVIFTIADALLADEDDMVQKGLGWVLKETYPARPRELMAYLLPRKAATSRLVLRLAAEKMTVGDRAVLLG